MPTELVSTAGDNFLFPEKEFGIVGGGVNEATLLQAAINLASSQGRILVLPPFEITVGSILTIPATGIRIWGQSGNTVIPLSSVKSTFNGAIFLMNTSFQSEVEFNTFLIKGGKSVGSSQHGISITGTNQNRFTIRNITITECGGNGINIAAGMFSYILDNIISSDNAGHQFFIDANTSPCVMLQNCYAGIVADTKYGYYIPRGFVEMVNCNSLNGTVGALTCLKVGDGISGSAVVTCRNCNFEDFTQYGIFVDVASDIRLYNCYFSAPGTGTVQPIYMIEPRGRSYIDAATTFITGGAVYDNADNLAIKCFYRWIDAPAVINPILAPVDRFWNQESGRSEPLANATNRMPTQSVTAASYTETRPTVQYYGVNRAGAVAIILLDPVGVECYEGRPVTIKDESGAAGANNITITTTNARTIDGAASVVISTNYGRVTLVKRGNNYWRID